MFISDLKMCQNFRASRGRGFRSPTSPALAHIWQAAAADIFHPLPYGRMRRVGGGGLQPPPPKDFENADIRGPRRFIFLIFGQRGAKILSNVGNFMPEYEFLYVFTATRVNVFARLLRSLASTNLKSWYSGKKMFSPPCNSVPIPPCPLPVYIKMKYKTFAISHGGGALFVGAKWMDNQCHIISNFWLKNEK